MKSKKLDLNKKEVSKKTSVKNSNKKVNLDKVAGGSASGYAHAVGGAFG